MYSSAVLTKYIHIIVQPISKKQFTLRKADDPVE